MTFSITHKLPARGVFALALLSLLFGPAIFSPAARAQDQSQNQSQAQSQDHIVSSQTLQRQVETTSAKRQDNIDTLNRVLSTPIAERAMQSKHIDATKVRTAIPTLSDAELANLAARANDAQQKFAAGLIGTGLLVVILLAIIVIIVVAAIH